MDMTPESGLAYPKPEPRKRVKARTRELYRDYVARIRHYVFARERDICRCCRCRRAESMHELVFKSLRGKVSKRNSVAVCGSGTTGCHGFMQRHQIIFGAGAQGAESILTFTPITDSAAEHLRIKVGKTIYSPLMRECDAPETIA